MPKRTIQLSVWCDDDDDVAAFINGIDLMAQAAFDRHEVVFSGPGVKKVNAARGKDEGSSRWQSANVSGRMRRTS
ncbi:hypothetical protein BH24ACT5_BH24ACT5_11680 [soil metagenome]